MAEKQPSTVSKKRHRFQRVEERVANLQTELQLHLKTNANEASLTFQEELGLQGELTLVESFQTLFRKLQPLVTTTPQLLHNLKKVVKLLKAELQAEPVAEIQRERLIPVLKLITALARELRKEFYPHFASVLPLMIDVIDTKDPELSTQVFKTITMLFNILRVQLLKDMGAVHKCYFPLLGHPRPFVREFAAQTLSVLLRRIDDNKQLRKYLATYLRALARGAGRENQNLRDGSATLFFALLKNVNHGFHSRVSEIFVALLGSFRPTGSSDDAEDAQLIDEERALTFDIVSRTCELMVQHTDADHATTLFDCFAHVIKKMVARAERSDAVDVYLTRIASVVLASVKHKSGKLVAGHDANATIVHQICSTLLSPQWMLTETQEELREGVLRLLEAVWRLCPPADEVVARQVAQLFAQAKTSAFWRRELLVFIQRSLRHSHVSEAFVRTHIFPNAMALAMDTLLPDSSELAAFALLVGELGSYLTAHPDVVDDNPLVTLRAGYRFLSASSASTDALVIAAANGAVSAALDATDSTSADTRALAWQVCRAVALLDVAEAQRLQFAEAALARVERRLASQPGDALAPEWRVLQAELWRVRQIARTQSEGDSKKKKKSKTQPASLVDAMLGETDHSFAMLSAFLEFVQMQTPEQQRSLLPASELERAERVWASNLRSPSREIRLVTLEILSRFERLPYTSLGDDVAANAQLLEGACEVLDHALQAETLCGQLSVHVEREIVRHINRVAILCRSTQTPLVYKKMAVAHLLGLFHVKFSTLWPHVTEALASVVPTHLADVWPSLSDEIWFSAFRSELPTPSGDCASASSLEELPRDAREAVATAFARACRVERRELDVSVVTDALTHHSLVYKTLEKLVDAAETKTKFLVPVFLLFLRDQYGALYADELSPRDGEAIDGVLVRAQSLEAMGDRMQSYAPPAPLPSARVVRQRLLDHLRLLAAFRNMKGAFAQTVLYDVLFDHLLLKSDDAVSKLALQCILGFGHKALAAYKPQLARVADAATFREELATFHIAPDAGLVLHEHRPVLLPVLLRLLYAKAVSRKGRNAGDTVGARRAAILSYLAALPAEELLYFVELVVRPFGDVAARLREDVAAGGQRDRARAPVAVESVSPSRVLGFLKLAQDLIVQLGVHLTPFVPTLADVVVSVVCHSFRDADEEMPSAEEQDEQGDQDDDDDAVVHGEGKAQAMRKQIRVLALRRLAELVDAFDARVALAPWVDAALQATDSAILRLPGAVVGADKPSALLELVVAVAGGDRARLLLGPAQIRSVILCLSSGLGAKDPEDGGKPTPGRGVAPTILIALIQILSSLLDGDEARADRTDAQLLPLIPFLLTQLVTRFESKAARYAQERYAGSSKRELALLCRVAQHVESAAASLAPEERAVQQAAAVDLFQLLLPFLQRSHRTAPADMENILQVLARLVALVPSPTRHVGALAKLLAPGPNGLTERNVRARLVEVFAALAAVPGEDARLAVVATALQELNAFDAKRIEDADMETRITALQRVNAGQWTELSCETWLLAPVVAQVLQCMHDAEYSLRSTALAGVTALVTQAAAATAAQQPCVVLLNVLESLVMPCVRFSIKVPSEDVRRGFVTLLATLADATPLHRLPFVPGDLALVRRADDIESDFFYNVTHIQMHRKRRALVRLGALMQTMGEAKRAQELASTSVAASDSVEQARDEDEHDEEEEEEEEVQAVEEKPSAWLSNSTVQNILLPLVMHFVYESTTKAQESLRTEASHCIGRAASLLGWSHYLALLRRLLKSIDGHGELETSIIATICAVIDHHHFADEAAHAREDWAAIQRHAAAAAAPEDAVARKVQDQMEAQVLPLLKKYLFKAATAKGAARMSATTSFDDSIVASQHVTVRVPMALAIVKVLRRLRPASFYLEFPKLLVSLVKLLKSKQEEVRSSARVTLVRIVEELGTAFLLPVVEELRHTLQDGYMTHVLAYTLHAILEKVSEIAQPKAPPSLLAEGAAPAESAFASELDACLPSVLAIIVEDLFRGVVESQDGSEYKSKMKEAKSTTKSLDALELLARSITFLPNASIHTVVSAVVAKFQETPENAKSLQVLQEALRRLALGLVKNRGVERSHLFLYAYNVLQSCLESIRPLTDAEKAKYDAVKRSSTLATAWQVSEKSARAAAQLARRVSARDTVKVHAQTKMTGFDRHAIDDAQRQASRAHLDELLSFGAYVLLAFIRAGDKGGDEAVHAALVDPLVPQLMRCASESKSDRAVIHALKCLSVLLHSPRRESLPSLDLALQPLVDRLFKILQKAGAATKTEMVQTCYRTLTVVLRHKPEFRLTEAQLRVLVSFVRADLDETDHQNATYGLLKSIIASRLVIPEIYDLVVRVGEILVQSDTQTARANCATIFITFLLEYPLGAKRLTQHLHFLLKNLAYEYESGRKAVLETLHALLKKLPLELINDKAQFFLLPLVLRLANDEAAGCRTLAAEAIKTLVRRMGNQALNETMALVATWWKATDRTLVITAAQVTQLVLVCRAEFVDKHAVMILSRAQSELQHHVALMSRVEESVELDCASVQHLLACVEQLSESLIVRFESWLLDRPGFWADGLLVLLEFPHVRVRLAALRVLSSYLRRRDVATLTFHADKRIKKNTPELTAQAAAYLGSRGVLFTWASRVCRLLERPQLTEELADDVVVVLSILCNALGAHPTIPQDVSADAQPASVSDNEAQEDTASGDDDEQEAAEDKSDAEEASAKEELPKQETDSKTPLGWVLTRLSFVARGASDLLQSTIYKFFAAFIHANDAAVVQRYVLHMVNPLLRAASALQKDAAVASAQSMVQQSSRGAKTAAPAEPPASALLAQEVMERLEQKIGATAFLEAYTFVQKRLAVFRATRREKRKRELVNDPELAAKRKMQKNDLKKRAKQMKKRKFAVLKGTVSAATKPRKLPRPGAE
ncbi:hypothetical protein ATCC90586_000493 [Pythium insidiosum]|nr:hypothetical protein ATCC90586_000493 [Pythium insidiosum]